MAQTEIKTCVGVFIGQEIAAQGVNPPDAKKNPNQPWTKMKYKFQIGGMQEWNFTSFNTKVALTLGKTYQISYSEYHGTHPQHGPYTSKNLVGFQEVAAGAVPMAAPTQQAQAPMPQGAQCVWPTDAQVNQVAELYVKQVQQSNRNFNHFLGTLIRQYNKDKMAGLQHIFLAHHAPTPAAPAVPPAPAQLEM